MNGDPVGLGADDRFSVEVAVTAGQNSFALVAVDRAGNRTERTVSVMYRPAEVLILSPDLRLPRTAEGGS